MVRTIFIYLNSFIVNNAPVLNTVTDPVFTVYDDEEKTWTVTLGTNPDVETITFSGGIYANAASSTALTRSWFSVVSSSATQIVVKVSHPALEAGSTVDTYAIKVTASDGLKSASATIDLTVKFNNPPTVTNAASLDLGSSVAGV